MSNDNSVEIEMGHISDMIKHAENYDLLCEVIRSFHGHAAEGMDIESSCNCALEDWDL